MRVHDVSACLLGVASSVRSWNRGKKSMVVVAGRIPIAKWERKRQDETTVFASRRQKQMDGFKSGVLAP